MPRFVVRVAEVHNAYYEVEAETEDGAIEAVKDGGGDVLTVEYSYTLDSDRWDAEQED